MTKLIYWLLAALLAFSAGVFLLNYLVAKPVRMSLYLAGALILAFIWVVIAWRYFQGWQLLGNVLLGMVFVVAGYLVANGIYLAQEEHRNLPQITRQPGDPSNGHTAVLYYTHGEPPAYSAMPWIETFHELDSDGVSFIPRPFRPFFLYNLRREYLAIGGSAHNKVHQIMLHSLEETMPVAKSRGVRFYQGFLDNPPRPDEVAIQAVNEGASKLVVMPVFLTDSSHTQAGQEMLEALELEKTGVQVCYASPLWDSPSLRQMFLERAAQNLDGVDKSRVAILLVGHGQPEDWDKIYPTQTEQETLFRQAVREMLIQDGYQPENVVLAWMEFKEPNIQQAVEELFRNGIERLLVFSASISADSIHSDIQVPEAVHSVPNPNNVEIVNLGAWGDDPWVIAAIRQKILDCDPSLEALTGQ